MSDEQLKPHTITSRDFLYGGVWEGTGEELHTNRDSPAAASFGGRILSGISGMLLTIGASDPGILWDPIGRLEWSFDSPIHEGDTLQASGRRTATSGEFEARVDGTRVNQGSFELDGQLTAAPLDGQRTPGRSMTAADLELFSHWFPAPEQMPAGVPWPLLVLTASQLVTRFRHRDGENTLNRWFRWSFGPPLPVEESICCVVGNDSVRASKSRPGMRVGTFEAAIVAGRSGHEVARVEWVVIVQDEPT